MERLSLQVASQLQQAVILGTSVPQCSPLQRWEPVFEADFRVLPCEWVHWRSFISSGFLAPWGWSYHCVYVIRTGWFTLGMGLDLGVSWCQGLFPTYSTLRLSWQLPLKCSNLLVICGEESILLGHILTI